MIKFEGNNISGGDFFENATIISKGEISNEYTINSKTDYDELKRLLLIVANSSKNSEEIEHASYAAELCGRDKKSLKSYIIENISSFVTGSFATVAGGMLLAMIQNLIK